MFRRWKGLALALCLALICLPTISLAQDAFYFDYYYEETVTDEYYYDSYDAGYGGGWVETVYYLLPAINIGGCEYND